MDELLVLDREAMRSWCDSVQETFDLHSLSDIPRGEAPKQVSEVFLHKALEYIRLLSNYIPEAYDGSK